MFVFRNLVVNTNFICCTAQYDVPILEVTDNGNSGFSSCTLALWVHCLIRDETPLEELSGSSVELTVKL